MKICDYIYGIFENGELVYQGTNYEVANRYGLNPRSIYEYPRRGMKIRDRYTVKIMNQPGAKQVDPPRHRTVHEIRLEHLVTHLRIYGNCASVFDPVPYFPDLLDLGMNCRCREIRDHDGLWYLTEIE